MNFGGIEMTLIQIVTGDIGTVHKGLWKRLEELDIRLRIDNIETTVLLKSARILRSDLRRFVVNQTPGKDQQLIQLLKLDKNN